MHSSTNYSAFTHISKICVIKQTISPRPIKLESLAYTNDDYYSKNEKANSIAILNYIIEILRFYSNNSTTPSF